MTLDLIRRLDQPGPATEVAFRAVPCRVEVDRVSLPENRPLAEVLIEAAGKGGSAAFLLDGLAVQPLTYNLPSLSDDPARAAWYAGPFSTPAAVIDRGCVFVGSQDGRPALHCHARWRLPDGTTGAGHILLDQTVTATTATVQRARIDGAVFDIQADRETNFSIFHPVERVACGHGIPGLLVKLSPNVDFIETLEAAAEAHDMSEASVVAAVGSLVGGSFEDAPAITDPITEVFSKSGRIGGASGSRVDAIAVDPTAAVHQGRLRRGGNAVGITFEVLLTVAERNAP